jgi:hypothetical protein
MAVVGRIEDEALRRQTFAQRKRDLIKQAMELSILCDCDVQLFVHSAKVGAGAPGPSTQFSSADSDALIAHRHRHPAAECFGKDDYWRVFAKVLRLQ